MSTETILLWMMGVFLMLMLFTIFSKNLNFVGNFLVNAVVGLSSLFAANYFLAPMGYAVGINVYTAAVSGILGFSGTLLLYALKFLV